MSVRASGRWLAMTAALIVPLLPIAGTPANAVVGGTSAAGNTAVVRLINGSSSCSGALWTSRIVITAGHCVVTLSGTVTTRPIYVYAPGANTQQSPQTVSQSAIITVDGWRRFGEYSQPDDIAFIVLSADLPGASISRLATTNEVSAWSREGRVVTFLGYGRTSPTGGASVIPNSIDQRLIPFPSWPGSFTAQQTLTSGICSGDSGGSVVTQVGSELVLIGIASAASGPCATSSRPSMTGFIPSAFPELMRRSLELTSVVTLPQVTTGAATGISGTSAILNATAVGNNLLTTVSFSYGLQPDLSGATITLEAGQATGTTPTAFELAVTNLVPGNTYYYRANASSIAGAVSGAISSFVTVGGTPIVEVGAASEVSSDSAKLTGTVNANSVQTVAFFQYSRTPDFAVVDGTAVAGDVLGNETATFSASIGGLEPGTTYFWRIAASNGSGTSISAPQSFTTPVFSRSTSLSQRVLLAALLVERRGTTTFTVVPIAQSRAHCAINSRTKRIVFGKPGVCRLRISTVRNDETSTALFNLVVR